MLTPTLGTAAPAVMNVNFDNKTYSFHVAPGARAGVAVEGLRAYVLKSTDCMGHC